ncbi:MAG: type III pantothenate kinase [Alistipes sp.]|nr:type III pantothenate kinase [Alistipes sp.]
MNLLVDIGNTRTKWAVMTAAGELLAQGVDELDRTLLDGLFARYALRRAMVTSTRGSAVEEVALLRDYSCETLLFTADTPVPIGIDYLTPETLGRDRVAAAVGAWARFPGRACLVADFGTALTIDYLSSDGVFHGGAISLGVSNRLRALHEYTAALPLCAMSEEEVLLGRSTREAIEQGVMNSVQFELEGYIERMSKKNADLCVIFTGGEAKYFEKRIKNTIFAEPNLVFCGLNRILEYNATTEK